MARPVFIEDDIVKLAAHPNSRPVVCPRWINQSASWENGKTWNTPYHGILKGILLSIAYVKFTALLQIIRAKALGGAAPLSNLI